MLLSLMISLVAASASSQPVAIDPPDPLALRITLQTIAEDLRDQACGVDVACWRRFSLRAFDGLSAGIGGMQLQESMLDVRGEQLSLAMQANSEKDKALADAADVLKQKSLVPDIAPHREPVLWLTIGLIAGAALVFGAVAAANGIQHALH